MALFPTSSPQTSSPLLPASTKGRKTIHAIIAGKGRVNEECFWSQRRKHSKAEISLLSFLWGFCLPLSSFSWMTAQKAFTLGFPVPSLLGSLQPRQEVVKASGCSAIGPSVCLISLGGKEGAGALKRLKAFQSSERDQRWRRRRHPAPTPPPKLTLRLEGRGQPHTRLHTLALLFHRHVGPRTPLLICSFCHGWDPFKDSSTTLWNTWNAD